MNLGGTYRWISAARSHTGLLRERNEDACLERPERGLWAVADGMGGHALGELASRLVVDALDKVPAPPGLTEYVTDAWDALQSANRQLRAEAAQRAVSVIGSTVVAFFARNDRCHCLWAGDSRLYRYRTGHLNRITRDHSHPDAPNLLTRAVGATDLLEIDEESIDLADGDLFLLCSDGLSNEVSDDEICAALAGGDCRQAADLLIELALRHGGRDNISVIAIRAEDPHHADPTVVNPAVL